MNDRETRSVNLTNFAFFDIMTCSSQEISNKSSRYVVSLLTEIDKFVMWSQLIDASQKKQNKNRG